MKYLVLPTHGDEIVQFFVTPITVELIDGMLERLRWTAELKKTRADLNTVVFDDPTDGRYYEWESVVGDEDDAIEEATLLNDFAPKSFAASHGRDDSSMFTDAEYMGVVRDAVWFVGEAEDARWVTDELDEAKLLELRAALVAAETTA